MIWNGVVAALDRLIPSASRRMAMVTTAELVIEDLAVEFDGYTIAVLADFHHRASMHDLRWLRHAVDSANSVSPDLVALLGDYGSSFKKAPSVSQRWYRDSMTAMTPLLRDLRAHDGIVAVLGNHDHYASASLVRAWLTSLDAELLVNRARFVTRSASRLRVAGLDDVAEGVPDPTAGCELADQTPTVLISHDPDGLLGLDSRLRIDVMLAGHTHGGQIVVPGYGAPITMSRICGRRSASGWVPNQRASLYVTRGLGEQLPLPIRINSVPEVLVLRLRSRSLGSTTGVSARP
jgi:predicted MPP superfamily phosphohydrolase